MANYTSIIRMSKKWALNRRAQYNAIYESGITKLDKFVVIRALANNLEITRFGYSISKRIGNAVTRNRIRRLFREIARSLPIKQGVDIIFIARTEAANADYHQLKKSITRLLSQAELLVKFNEAVIT
jgi:ribonuclease P protein component